MPPSCEVSQCQATRRSSGTVDRAFKLVPEYFNSEPRVQLRVVEPTPFHLAVLVVLDQVMIGIAGKGERVEPQRIYSGQFEKFQFRCGGPKVREVELDQIVSEHIVGAIGDVVQPRKGLLQTFPCTRKN